VVAAARAGALAALAVAAHPGADAIGRARGAAVAELDGVVVAGDEAVLADQAVAVRVVAGRTAVVRARQGGGRDDEGQRQRGDECDA